ncbi:MAG: hypothetical protein JWP11_3102 [Frankiales bacterium]|nr:hypothetical protein [Frankiales bacterium]
MADLLRTSLVALVAGISLAGCGGSSAPRQSAALASDSPVPGTTPAPTASGAAPGASAGAAVAARNPSDSSSRPSPAAGASAAGSPSPAASYTRIVLDASLSSTCVTPGGSLTLTMRARPDMNVILDTRYPDGKDGQVHGGFDVHGHTDATGHYALTWKVDPLTPTGDADVQVAAVDHSASGNRRLPFKVAAACG